MEIWRRFKSRIVKTILRIRMNFTKRRYVIKMYTHFSRSQLRQLEDTEGVTVIKVLED